jgi:hypothetical protein
MDGGICLDSEWLIILGGVGAVTFLVGLLAGFFAMRRYHDARFLVVAQECSAKDSLVPLIIEMERET